MKVSADQIVSTNSRWDFNSFLPRYTKATITLKTTQFNMLLDEVNNWETCVFFAGGENEVLGRFDNMEDAVAFHKEMAVKYGLRKTTYRMD